MNRIKFVGFGDIAISASFRMHPGAGAKSSGLLPAGELTALKFGEIAQSRRAGSAPTSPGDRWRAPRFTG
jgi:hypothetical protein